MTAFILAGGRSSRMGSDKALLSFGGQTLLQRALQTAAAAAETIAIVGPGKRYAPYGEVIEDVYAGCGPLAGIHAALAASKTDLNLMLSVDMPLMTADFLRWLARQAQASDETIVVPDVLGGPQPLCALYRRQVRKVAEEALKRGEYKIGRLFSQVPTRYLSEQEITTAGFSITIFSNVNTREEFEALAVSGPVTSNPEKGSELR
ncbi:MAG: molybdenum cofactor guanylyltransferase [Candidatus Korobacteraceae bacterium]